MRKPGLFIAVILSLVWITHVPAAPRNAPAATRPNLQVNYIHPERFTDFGLQGQSAAETARIFATSVGGPLSQALARNLPGARLTLTFTDIDLAGRYEPWRGPQFFDIR